MGGNSLGFYGGVFSPDGQSIMSHGYHGAFELRTLNMVIYYASYDTSYLKFSLVNIEFFILFMIF